MIPERLDVKDPSLARFGGTEDRRDRVLAGVVWKHPQHLMVWTENTQIKVSMALRVLSCFHWPWTPLPFWVPVGSDH